MSGKRPNVKDALKRNRELRPKLFVVIICALIIIYVMDSSALGMFIVGVLGYIMTSLKNDIWEADWKRPEAETSGDEQSPTDLE
ncbi:hypothetical protein [Rhizobium sp. P44RR-XXIV]|uniref:hypothetical protein n=1 Tax=Rhizobium sp. P44RR-XXIV TaxID=1921145 RepID=UPI0009843B09|nr:hypothetical protein [Rhizobium sp. P44RR-XXIV]TIX89167.1 hypothetical protein BSK43_021400 [Rhizobium sp. P44RR-XXIV]